MRGDAPLSWLMFFTLAAGVVVATVLFLSFLRSRHNRELASQALLGDGRSAGFEASGAGVELGGLLVLGMVVMALLTFGYRAQSGTAIAEHQGAANNQLASERTNPASPKPYQPSNPAPDPRKATTSSSTGTGADSGGHPEALDNRPPQSR